MIDNGEMQELLLPVYCSCSVFTLKQLIASKVKVPEGGEQILTVISDTSYPPNLAGKREAPISGSNSILLQKDERFLFEYLPLTSFVEEELKKKNEGKNQQTLNVGNPHGSIHHIDAFNMKVIENELLSNNQ